jgi:hypothetical protein
MLERHGHHPGCRGFETSNALVVATVRLEEPCAGDNISISATTGRHLS